MPCRSHERQAAKRSMTPETRPTVAAPSFSAQTAESCFRVEAHLPCRAWPKACAARREAVLCFHVNEEQSRGGAGHAHMEQPAASHVRGCSPGTCGVPRLSQLWRIAAREVRHHHADASAAKEAMPSIARSWPPASRSCADVACAAPASALRTLSASNANHKRAMLRKVLAS